MKTSIYLPSASSEDLVPVTDQLRLAVAAYLARFKGASRSHTESDLRCYLTWCAERGLDPLAARRPHLELYIRWMQEVRRFKPSTISRRFSVATGFYRTCVIDGLLEHSPADHVRRPSVPPESPILGFTHLQFEAPLTAARQSPCPCDFALTVMLGLLGLRIFEATGADIADLGEEHGHRVLRVCGKEPRSSCCHCHPPLAGPSTKPSAAAPGADPAQQPRRPDGPPRRHPPASASGRSRRRADRPAAPPHAPSHLCHDHAQRGRGPARCPDRRPPC
jgi:hypothetical protein